MMDSTFDDVGDDKPNAGPASVPLDAQSPERTTRRRKTVAWSDNDDDHDAVVDEVQSPNSNGSQAQRRGTQRGPSKPVHKLALCVVLLQASWALIIPVKNIATVVYPTVLSDSSKSQNERYLFADPQTNVGFTVQPISLRGTEIIPLLSEVLDIAFGNDYVRQDLIERSTFDVDPVLKLLSLEEFAVMSKYYSLVHQSTEFPAATFTPRWFRNEGASDRMAIFLRDSTSSDNRDIPIELKCSERDAFLKGARCDRYDGYPCDMETPIDDRTYTDVNLEKLAPGTGLENNVALMYVIEYFHEVMSTAFATRNWRETLMSMGYNESTEVALEAGSAMAFKNDIPYLMDRDAYLVGIQAGEMETLQLDSCVATELVVALFYIRTFVLHLVHEGMMKHGVFAPGIPNVAVPSTMASILKPVFEFNVTLTSGARSDKVMKRQSTFLRNFHVATMRTAAAQFKFDRQPLRSDQASGSSVRLLQNLVYYPDLVSTFKNTRSKDPGTGVDCDIQTYKFVGSISSDIPVYKESYTATSLAVYPLAEQSDPVKNQWWSDEKKYADWFRVLETLPAAPFKVFNSHLQIVSRTHSPPTDDIISTRCQRALFKVVGKIAYLALLGLSKPTSYLMFMGDVSTGARAWLINQIYREELIGETFSGERIAFSYRSGTTTRKDDGSAWVVIPLLDAMITFLGKDETAAVILQELGDSLHLFLKASSGSINFPDAVGCYVSGTAGSPNEVTADDSVEDIIGKILPGLQSAILDLIDRIPSTALNMKNAILAQDVEWVQVRGEDITGNPVITNTTEGRGPPGQWQPTALTAGFLKFWPPKTPTKSAVDRLREATVCYRMLDTRFLNETTRCFAEPSNAVIIRSDFRSEEMRKFFLSNWTMAVMLNTMAGVVVFKYMRKLIKAWRVTRFECLDLEVALQLNLQGMGVLSVSQTLLLLAASIPALVGFHIPADPTFLPRYLNHEKMPKVLSELFVTLSMSWFLKFGFDVCNGWISAKRPADWYHLFRVRWCMLVLIYGLRMIIPAGRTSDSYFMWKLVWTCLISLGLGACCTAVIFLPERPGKVVDADRKENHDAVVAALVKQNLPLSRYGVLGRTSKGWSKTGLIVEGWRLARRTDGREVLRKDGGEILLPEAVAPASLAPTGDPGTATSGNAVVVPEELRPPSSSIPAPL